MIANTTFLSRMDYWLELLELTTKNELLNFHSLPFVSLSAASYPRAFHAGRQQLLGTNGPARRSGRLQVLPGKENTRNAINNVCIFSGELELARSRGLCGKFRWIKNVCKRKRLLPMGNWIPYSSSNTMNLTTLQNVFKYMSFLCSARETFADQYRQRFKVIRNTLEP